MSPYIAMDFVHVKKYNAVMEELQFSCHSQMYIRELTMKRYNKMIFVFNLHQYPDGLWKPLYSVYINDIRQHSYIDSHWCQSDEIIRAQEHRAEMCTNEECYCKPWPHHTFEVDQDKTKRYFELVLDIGDIVDGHNNGKRKPKKDWTMEYL